MTTEQKETVVTLVITDGIFGNQCDDASAYVVRLKEVMARNKNRDVSLVSVCGNRGICDIDPTVTEIELDTKNKTQFIQSLENNVGLFDEILIIKLVDDMFLNGARQAATELNKPLFTYGYNRKVK